MAKALDQFGEFVIAKLRDAAIDRADGLLTARWQAPDCEPCKPTSAG